MQVGMGYRDCLFDPDVGVRPRLLDSLRWLAQAAESLGQTFVVETHLLTIMRSPEFNRAIVRDVGSARLVMDYVNHFQTLHQVYDSRARAAPYLRLHGADQRDWALQGHCGAGRLRDPHGRGGPGRG